MTDVDMTVMIPQALQRFAFSVVTNNRESVCGDAPKLSQSLIMTTNETINRYPMLVVVRNAIVCCILKLYKYIDSLRTLVANIYLLSA
jgi:hypothetical protein